MGSMTVVFILLVAATAVLDITVVAYTLRKNSNGKATEKTPEEDPVESPESACSSDRMKTIEKYFHIPE